MNASWAVLIFGNDLLGFDGMPFLRTYVFLTRNDIRGPLFSPSDVLECMPADPRTTINLSPGLI